MPLRDLYSQSLASERPLTHAVDSAATKGIGTFLINLLQESLEEILK